MPIKFPYITVNILTLTISMLGALAAPASSQGRTLGGFEVPYTFNPIRRGPGWNDSDVWVVTLTSNADGVGICNVYRKEDGSNTLVILGVGFAHGKLGSAISVRIDLPHDPNRKISHVPAKIGLFENGVTLMSLEGNLSADTEGETWSAVLLGSQLHSLIEGAVKGRVSANFSTDDNRLTASSANLISSPYRLRGQIFPREAGIYAGREFTECLRRAKIIGSLPWKLLESPILLKA